MTNYYTETNSGPPISLQFYTEDMGTKSDLFMVDQDNVLQTFVRYIDKLPSSTFHVMFAHNLKFDLPSLLWPLHKQLIRRNGFDFTVGHWHFNGVHGSPSFAKLYNKSRKTTVYLLDSFLWFQTSLAKAAELVCPDLPKLKEPKGLGTKTFRRSDRVFSAYAMRDAEVSYHLGKVVQGFHSEFDISQSLTLAHMAAKIFRKHFLRRTLEQPSEKIMLAAQQSYHGGKNNLLPGSSPKWHTDVVSLDISSAYPFAMSQLPSFSNEKLYRKATIKASDRRTYNNGVPRFGVYNISGNAKDCPWPSLFDRSFNPIRGKFNDVWVNGFDLNAALKAGEVKLHDISGYFYDFERDRHQSPFNAFVSDFYQRKEAATDPIQRYMYKTVLNSLYGKFIQTTRKEDEATGETIYEAGGMYHPFIASAITAHTRSYIHDIEHTFGAIHTATDGIFAPNSKGLAKTLTNFNRGRKTDEGLGSLKLEASGDLLLLRNKLYILYSDTDGKISSKFFKNKNIVKYALHGFQSSVYTLEELVASNRRRYETTRPNQLRESLKSKGAKVPNNFETRGMVLKVGPIGVA
jgi:hypothetical protein